MRAIKTLGWGLLVVLGIPGNIDDAQTWAGWLDHLFGPDWRWLNHALLLLGVGGLVGTWWPVLRLRRPSTPSETPPHTVSTEQSTNEPNEDDAVQQVHYSGPRIRDWMVDRLECNARVEFKKFRERVSYDVETRGKTPDAQYRLEFMEMNDREFQVQRVDVFKEKIYPTFPMIHVDRFVQARVEDEETLEIIKTKTKEGKIEWESTQGIGIVWNEEELVCILEIQGQRKEIEQISQAILYWLFFE